MIAAGPEGRIILDVSADELSDIVNVLELRVLDLLAKAERMPDPGRRRTWLDSAARLSRLSSRLLENSEGEP